MLPANADGQAQLRGAFLAFSSARESRDNRREGLRLSRWHDEMLLRQRLCAQLSALVTILGFHSDRAIKTIAPYGAEFHSTVFVAEQMGKEKPIAIIGLFDISQRSKSFAGYLSLTTPQALWRNLDQDLEMSCLTTQARKQIEERVPQN